MSPSFLLDSAALGEPPKPQARLEEVSPADARDSGAALGFALARLRLPSDSRPLLLAFSAHRLAEWGRPFAQGAADSSLLLVTARNEAQVLWAVEEALKSGAVAGALGVAGEVAFVTTRRLDFAARTGGAVAILLRPKPAFDLSAAHLRWRISNLPTALHRLDARAPGSARWRAEAVRRRDGPPGVWELEQDHETHRLRLAARLAGDGLAAEGRTTAAA